MQNNRTKTWLRLQHQSFTLTLLGELFYRFNFLSPSIFLWESCLMYALVVADMNHFFEAFFFTARHLISSLKYNNIILYKARLEGGTNTELGQQCFPSLCTASGSENGGENETKSRWIIRTWSCPLMLVPVGYQP